MRTIAAINSAVSEIATDSDSIIASQYVTRGVSPNNSTIEMTPIRTRQSRMVLANAIANARKARAPSSAWPTTTPRSGKRYCISGTTQGREWWPVKLGGT